MTTINPATQFTPDDLLRLDGSDSLYELVDGILVEKTMSSLAGEAATLIILRVGPFIYGQKLGSLFMEASFRCFPHKPDQVRRPDIAFVSTARLPGVPRDGLIPIRPDLAIEIISPGNGMYDVDGKLRDYKAAGIPLTWVFNPEHRLARIYEAGRLKSELEAHEELRGEPVLPGFVVRVGELFPPDISAGT